MPTTSLQAPVSGAAERAPQPARGSAGGGAGQQLLVIASAIGLGWGVVGMVVAWSDVAVWSAEGQGPLLAVVAAVAAVAASALAWSVATGRRFAAPLVVAGTAITLSGLGTAALHGTRWGFNGLYSDAAFRTEAATRLADSPALSDYAYRGLPSYYPPALPWIEGRVADVTGLPAWEVMKPVSLVLAALVPVVAYLMWRRVLPDVPAALVVVATALATADLVKPDEWLVLAVVVPWWLHVVRDVHTSTVGRLPWWSAGLVLGALLLCHTFYFVPLLVATLAATLADVVARRPLPLPPGRALAVAAVGLLVAAPYWVPMVRLRLAGAASDSLQLRWSPEGFSAPPWPLPTSLVGALGLLGVIWVVFRARSSPLALSLGAALASSYAFMVGGQLVQRWNLALLPEKADELIVSLLVVTGTLALRDLHRLAGARGLEPIGRMSTGAVVSALAVALVLDHADHWLLGQQAQTAQHLRYPDGSYPPGGPFEESSHRHPWSVSPQPTGPSVDEVRSTWRRLAGRHLDDRSVVVTSRADLLATTPVHPFIVWKSIYSHPNGRFDERLRLLGRVSDCATSRCAWQLLRGNDLDRVDGLVLTVTASGLRLTVTTDAFPDGWTMTPVTFSPTLFRPPYFRRLDVRGVAVIVVTTPRTAADRQRSQTRSSPTGTKPTATAAARGAPRS